MQMESAPKLLISLLIITECAVERWSVCTLSGVHFEACASGKLLGVFAVAQSGLLGDVNGRRSKAGMDRPHGSYSHTAMSQIVFL